MKIHFKKVNGNYKGANIFAHVVQIKYPYVVDRLLAFNEVRTWCWETWGSACNYDESIYLTDSKESSTVNKHWAWDEKFGACRIFLVSDIDKTLFALRWVE